MAFRRWNAAKINQDKVNKLCEEMKLQKLAASVLAARGYDTSQAATAFLSDQTEFSSPFELKDMDKAANRINKAIENEEVIAVFGDYDVDGVTSTALMYQYLLGSGAKVVCSLPTRESTGYGLSNEAIDNMKRYDVSLIITVDNGISANGEIEYARSLGIDTVVCDHHQVPDVLPNAVAVVDPLRKDDEGAFKELAGVGVALKLAAACEGCGVEEMLDYYSVFAAIGTVSDIMPLIGENREIVKRGLAAVPECDNAGLLSLCEEAGLDVNALAATNIAFALAPRINAAGRMGNAALALRLLITDNVDEARTVAKELCELNKTRQQTEQEITKLIENKIDENPSVLNEPIIIVSGENFHSGVIGIVCSRLVEKYSKPAIVISVENGEAKGSGRSVKGFSLYKAICSCKDMLGKFGGHDMAAGFMLNADRIDDFKKAVFEYCANNCEGMKLPELRVDAYIDFADVSQQAINELSALAPFGCANEEPIFAVKDAEITAIALMGERHCKITFKQKGVTFSGALFSTTPSELVFAVGDRVDIALNLSIYESTNQKGVVSIKIKEIMRSGASPDDFESIDLYRAFCCQREKFGGDKDLIAPSRENVAYVYRKLKTKDVDRYDYNAVNVEFCDILTGKALASLDVLEELSLIKTKRQGAARVLTVCESERKRDLNESDTFRILNGEH